jgi:AbrB family looped-hinge helix DNA binding protein
MTTTTLTSAGRTTLPKDVRDHLGLEAGDKLDFHIQANGRVVVRAATRSVEELKGLLQQRGRAPVTLAAMEQAISAAAARARGK